MRLSEHLIAWMDRIDSAADVDAVHAALAGAIDAMGFTYHAFSVVDGAARPHLPFLLTNYPEEWRDHGDRSSLSCHDPVFRNALRSAEPVLWSSVIQRPDAGSARRIVVGPASECGLLHGGGLGVYGPRGELATLQVSGNGSATDFRDRFDQYRHALHLIVSHTHRVLRRLSTGDPPPRTTLTRRQQDVLLWAMLGKTNWEIGQILSIADDTVRQHMQSAIRTLGASNRTHAVVLALRQKLIDP